MMVDEQSDAPERRNSAFLKWIISRRRWVILIVIWSNFIHGNHASLESDD
jgi:hypothetical protein